MLLFIIKKEERSKECFTYENCVSLIQPGWIWKEPVLRSYLYYQYKLNIQDFLKRIYQNSSSSNYLNVLWYGWTGFLGNEESGITWYSIIISKTLDNVVHEGTWILYWNPSWKEKHFYKVNVMHLQIPTHRQYQHIERLCYML